MADARRVAGLIAAGFGPAILCVAAAAAVHQAIGLAVPTVPSYTTFYPAVLVAALWAGSAGGVLALILGALVSWVFFVPHPGSFAPDLPDTVGLALYFVASGLIVALAVALRRSRDRTRESEARLLRAQATGEIGDWDWEVETGRISWSASLYRMLGVDPASFVPTLARAAGLVHPADLAPMRSKMTALLRSDASRFDVDFRVVRPDGQAVWLASRGDIRRDQYGRATHVVGVCIDVTARRTAEEALRASEERYRTLLDLMTEGFVLAEIQRDEAGRAVDILVLAANPASARLTGRSPEEVIGTRQSEGEGPIAAEHIAIFDRVVQSGEPERFLAYAAAPGRWFETFVFATGGAGFAVFFQDVSDRRRAEIARERLLTSISAAMRAGQMGTWEYDRETETIRASESMDLLFGLPHDGKPRPLADYRAAMLPEDRARVAGFDLAPLAVNQDVAAEYRVRRPDGSVRWIAARGSPFDGLDGRRQLVGAIFDVTERKTAEQEREAALRRAELLFLEMNHRVKNNLQMISSMLHIQSRRFQDTAVVDVFQRARQRIATIADLHTELCRIEDIGGVEFANYLKNICDRLQATMPDGARIRVSSEADRAILPFETATSLGLVVNELVTNALKHAFAGGVGEIRVRFTEGAAGWHLTIADDGSGLGEEEGGDHAGLGMVLVDAFVQKLGGTIVKASRAGTRIDIVLPHRLDDADAA
jgi:PAS domain S-box-containing protein